MRSALRTARSGNRPAHHVLPRSKGLALHYTAINVHSRLIWLVILTHNCGEDFTRRKGTRRCGHHFQPRLICPRRKEPPADFLADFQIRKRHGNSRTGDIVIASRFRRALSQLEFDGRPTRKVRFNNLGGYENRIRTTGFQE